MKSHIDFDLGMIVGLCAAATFEAYGYKPFFEISLPWWVYAILAVIAFWIFIIKDLRR